MNLNAAACTAVAGRTDGPSNGSSGKRILTRKRLSFPLRLSKDVLAELQKLFLAWEQRGRIRSSSRAKKKAKSKAKSKASDRSFEAPIQALDNSGHTKNPLNLRNGEDEDAEELLLPDLAPLNGGDPAFAGLGAGNNDGAEEPEAIVVHRCCAPDAQCGNASFSLAEGDSCTEGHFFCEEDLQDHFASLREEGWQERLVPCPLSAATGECRGTLAYDFLYVHPDELNLTGPVALADVDVPPFALVGFLDDPHDPEREVIALANVVVPPLEGSGFLEDLGDDFP